MPRRVNHLMDPKPFCILEGIVNFPRYRICPTSPATGMRDNIDSFTISYLLEVFMSSNWLSNWDACYACLFYFNLFFAALLQYCITSTFASNNCHYLQDQKRNTLVNCNIWTKVQCCCYFGKDSWKVWACCVLVQVTAPAQHFYSKRYGSTHQRCVDDCCVEINVYHYLNS